MDNLTPSDKVRIQLEKAISQDAIARAKKLKRLDSAILPTFMGANGKVRRLGQEESNALILPNLYYGEGEEMRPIPTGRGGLMAVDNKPLIEQPVIVIAEPTPPPELQRFNLSLSLEQFSVFSDDLATSGSIGGTNYGVPYFLPDKTLDTESLASQQSLLPLIVDPLVSGDTDVGIGTITGSSSSPYYTARIDFSGQSNCFIGSSAAPSISSDDWALLPSITLNLEGYASLNEGGFSLITSLSHEFTEATPNAPNMFPDLFECTILEVYITWSFA